MVERGKNDRPTQYERSNATMYMKTALLHWLNLATDLGRLLSPEQ
jgi:hypothetical protein